MDHRGWRDLRASSKVAIVSLSALELVLFLAAQIDLTRRPAHQISGRKPVWRLIALVNLVGPLAYFRWGPRNA